jgi:hypothetical protein
MQHPVLKFEDCDNLFLYLTWYDLLLKSGMALTDPSTWVHSQNKFHHT